MPGSVDRPPSIIDEIRGLRSRLAELESRSLRVNSVVAARVHVLNTSVAHNTPTVISYTDVDFDTAGSFDVGDPTKLAAPVAGVYQIVAYAQCEGNSTGVRALEFSSANHGSDMRSAPGTATYNATISAVINLTEGQFVQVSFTQSSGISLLTSVWFSWARIGALG